MYILYELGLYNKDWVSVIQTILYLDLDKRGSTAILLVLDAVLSQDFAKTDSIFFYHLFYSICLSSVPVNYRHFLLHYIAVRMLSIFSYLAVCIFIYLAGADGDIFGPFGWVQKNSLAARRVFGTWRLSCYKKHLFYKKSTFFLIVH